MKKLFFVLIILFFIVTYIQSEEESEETIIDNPVIEDNTDISQPIISGNEEEPVLPGKTPFRIQDRVFFEIGLMNIDFGIANNFIRPFDFFRRGKTVELDFTNVNTGFDLGFDANIQPLFFNLMFNDDWGIGLDIARITAYGNLEIAGSLLQFNRTGTSGDKFGAGAAIFTEIGIPAYINIKRVWEERALKINFRPAGYVPLLYTVPDMTYYFFDREVDGQPSTYLGVDFKAKIFTPFRLSMEDGFDIDMSTFNVGSSLGIDISLGAEFPLFRWIDVGVDFINIPIVPSRLKYYMLIEDSVWMDTSKIGVGDLLGNDDFPEDFFYFPEDNDPKYGIDEQFFFRPFKMIFFADFRLFQLLDLFNTPVISILPAIGFSINPVFVNVASVEAALKFRVNLANLFITTFGFAYEDQMWKNGIDFILNFRAFELGLGISMQSQDFVKSWEAAGIRANFGLKFGW